MFCLTGSGSTCKVVATLLAVGLITFEVVNGSPDVFAALFARTDRVYLVTHHLHGLKRHHDFVILDIVTNQHQNPFCTHVRSFPKR
jgi:hypothetical protein